MQAVRPYQPGRVPLVELVEWPTPEAAPGELLIEVAATALNRADLLQLRGHYPHPADASPIPGLEAAGVVRAVGSGAAGFSVGDRVMALLAGGGHAQWVSVPAVHCLKVPPGVTLLEAAAIPEAGITAWSNLVEAGQAQVSERVLVTGASSGVGTFTVRLARELGLEVLAACRRVERLAEHLGKSAQLVELDEQLSEHVLEATDGLGVELIFDLVGGPWVSVALPALAPGGRYLLVGLVAGRSAKLDLSLFLQKRVRFMGSQVRPRPRDEKAQLIGEFAAFALPRLAEGRLRPTIARVYPWERIADAYADLERGGHVGKLVVDLAVGRS